MFSFFDPLLCYDKDELKVGHKYEFSVAGIAHLLKHVANPEFVVDSGPALELERQRALMENPDADISETTALTFSTANLRCLVGRDEPGSAEFQTLVEKVEWFDLEGMRMCRMKCFFQSSDEYEWSFTLYASEWILKGYQPKAGDNVQGVMWMQAHRIREVPSNESWIDRGSESEAKMEGLLRAFEAKEYLADLSPGVAALASSLITGGGGVTKYNKEKGETDVPDLFVEARDRQINVWVNAYFSETEQSTELSEELKDELSALSRQRGHESVFTTVKCRESENYYYYEFEGQDRLREIFGEVSFIEAQRIRGTEKPDAV